MERIGGFSQLGALGVVGRRIVVELGSGGEGADGGLGVVAGTQSDKKKRKCV